MSHGRERKEKNCLNCGTIVQGRFCHVCGQENNEPKETFWHLVSHFFYDITHFDGKFFHSLKYLFTRPGYLPKEYMAGRRASYLNPVRMYIFTSALFFLIFFSFFVNSGKVELQALTINGETIQDIEKMDSLTFAKFTANINKQDKKPALPMTRAEFEAYRTNELFRSGVHFTGTKYESRKQYDSILAAGIKKHNWVQRQLIYKEIDLNEKYHKDGTQIFLSFKNTLLHSIPQMLFISLPLLALLFKLIYARRKNFYYMSHAIFCIYLYIFLFLALLVLFSIGKLNNNLHWGFLSWTFGILVAALFFYEYKAMRNFYGQRRAKTILKFIVINLLFFILLVLLFVIFVFFSLFKL